MENLGLLPFGNVSVAVITLVVVAIAMALLLELGIWVVRLLIAADDENAPDIVIKNFVKDVITKVWGLLYKDAYTVPFDWKKKVVSIEGKWYVLGRSGEYLDYVDYMRGTPYENFRRLDSAYLKDCIIPSEAEAKRVAKMLHSDTKTIVPEDTSNLKKIVAACFLTDLTIFLASVNLTLTVVALGIFGVVFSTRFIAKKLYKTMSRTTKNEGDIKDLQETVKVKGTE